MNKKTPNKCNCIQKTEKAALKLLQDKNPEKDVTTADMQEVGFSMKGSITFSTINYTIRGKRKTINIYHSFCPFCGNPYPKLK